MIGVFRNIEGAQLRARGISISTFPVDENGVPSYDELVLVAEPRPAGRPAVLPLDGEAVRRRAGRRRPPTPRRTRRWRWRRCGNHVTGDQAALADSVTATLGLLDTTRLEPSAWEAFGHWMQGQGLLEQPPDGAALVASP